MWEYTLDNITDSHVWEYTLDNITDSHVWEYTLDNMIELPCAYTDDAILHWRIFRSGQVSWWSSGMILPP